MRRIPQVALEFIDKIDSKIIASGVSNYYNYDICTVLKERNLWGVVMLN